MGKKLYVGNLPFSANDSSLTDLFSQAGTVDSVRIVSDRETGRSRGFGFVEMSTDDEALGAIEKFNGAPMDGRPLTVNEARPQEPRSGGFGGGDRGGYSGGGGGYGGGGDRGGRGGFGGGGGARRERY